MNKDKIGNYLFVLVVLHTLFYVSMYAFQIYGFSRVVAVFSIPLLILAYLFKSVKFDYGYIIAMLLVAIGDITNSFWKPYYDYSIFLYALNLAYYSFYLLRELGEDLTVSRILVIAIPYTVCYLVIMYTLNNHLDGLSMATVLLYNLFMGIFAICSWIKLFYKRVRSSVYLVVSSSSVILMSIAYLFNKSLEKIRLIDDVLINILFLLFHAAMFLYIIHKEQERKSHVVQISEEGKA